MQENAGAVDIVLAPADLKEITETADRIDVNGDRYPELMQRWINR